MAATNTTAPPTPYSEHDGITIYHGDCLDVLPLLERESFTAVVTDPPYDLTGGTGGFMGQSWDATGVAFDPATWRAVAAVCKPGAPLLAFGGSRTSHRMVCAIEDAGWEIRDCLMWLFGSAMPTSLDISKAIDKAPATEAAKLWDGWGTGLKSAYEPILCAQKSLTTVPVDGRIVVDTQHLLGGLLCLLLLSAKNAKRFSRLSPAVRGEAFVSALMLAAVLCGEKSGELSATMDTCNSPEEVSMCLSIAGRWNNILVAILNRGSMFTTETVIGLTTALRTLNCLLSTNIPAEVIQAVSRPVGSKLNVQNVDASSTEEKANTNDIQKHFAAAIVSLLTSNAGTSARNVERRLRAIIPSVDSVLKHVLTEIATASGTPVSSGSASGVENDSEQSSLVLPSTAGGSAWPKTTLRPEFWPICLAMKPFTGTYAQNAIKHGVAGLNIDGSRIGVGKGGHRSGEKTAEKRYADRGSTNFAQTPGPRGGDAKGRWPANLLLQHHPECRCVGTRKIKGTAPKEVSRKAGVLKFSGQNARPSHDSYQRKTTDGHAGADGFETIEAWECHPTCPIRLLDEQSGISGTGKGPRAIHNKALRQSVAKGKEKPRTARSVGDQGGASRFFYCGKASNSDRGTAPSQELPLFGETVPAFRNTHPTVKPTALMEYLCRLVMPPANGLILDPFAGSGTTGVACKRLGIQAVLIEECEEYCELAAERTKRD